MQRVDQVPSLRTVQSSTSALQPGLLNILAVGKSIPLDSQMLFSPDWLCAEHHYLCRASVSMAITDGKCCGIIHVQKRRQPRRKGRWRERRGGTTWDGGDGGDVGIGKRTRAGAGEHEDVASGPLVNLRRGKLGWGGHDDTY